MTHGYDFGVRSRPPCTDCWDGHCTMNCGPVIGPLAAQLAGGAASAIAAQRAQEAHNRLRSAALARQPLDLAAEEQVGHDDRRNTRLPGVEFGHGDVEV